MADLSSSPRFHSALETRSRVVSTNLSASSRPISSLSSRLQQEPHQETQQDDDADKGSLPRVGMSRFKRSGSVHVFSENVPLTKASPIAVDKTFYGKLGDAVKDGNATLKDSFEIPPRDARSFTLPAGYLVR
jgi:hypothetical protein